MASFQQLYLLPGTNYHGKVKYIQHKGQFTNYVTHFLLLFDYPPTYCNAFAVILLMTCLSRLCNGNALDDHPPTPTALRDL